MKTKMKSDGNNDHAVSTNKRPRRIAKDKAQDKNKLSILGSRPMKLTKQKTEGLIKKPTFQDIEGFYTASKFSKIRTTGLETIHEVSEEVEETAEPPSRSVFGTRKVRRSVVFSQGSFVSKMTKRLRRSRIKKFFGRLPKLAKLNMKQFLERLNEPVPENTSVNLEQIETVKEE